LGAVYGASKAPSDDISAQLRGAAGGGLGTVAGGILGTSGGASVGGLGGAGIGALLALLAGAHGKVDPSQLKAMLAAGAGSGGLAGALAGAMGGGVAGNIYGAQRGTQMALGDQMKTSSPKRSAAFERAMKYLRK